MTIRNNGSGYLTQDRRTDLLLSDVQIGYVHYSCLFSVCPTKGSGTMSTNYDELTARAECGDLKMKPGTVRRGTEAAAEAQRLLMEATGATTADELTALVAR